MLDRAEIYDTWQKKVNDYTTVLKDLEKIQQISPIQNYASLVLSVTIEKFKYLLSDFINLFQPKDPSHDLHVEFIKLMNKVRTTTRNTILCPVAYPKIITTQLCYDVFQIVYPAATYNDFIQVLLFDVDTLYTIDLQWHKHSNGKKSIEEQTTAVLTKINVSSSQATERIKGMDLDQLLIVNNYIFYIPEVITGGYAYFRLVYNLLSTDHPELYKQIKLRNLNAQVIYDKVELLEQQALTVGQQIEKLANGIVIGGEKSTGREFAHPHSRKAFKAFIDYLNACPPDDKKAILALADSQSKYTVNKVYYDLDHGRCVETASFELKQILLNKANAFIFNKTILLNAKAKQQLIQEINYLGNDNQSTEHTVRDTIEDLKRSLQYYSEEKESWWNLSILLQIFNKNTKHLSPDSKDKLITTLITKDHISLETILRKLSNNHESIIQIIEQLNDILSNEHNQQLLNAKVTSTQNSDTNLSAIHSLENQLSNDGMRLDCREIPEEIAKKLIAAIKFHNVQHISILMGRFEPKYYVLFAGQKNILEHFKTHNDLAHIFFWLNIDQSRTFCRQFKSLFVHFAPNIDELIYLFRCLSNPYNVIVLQEVLVEQIVNRWLTADDIINIYSKLTSVEKNLLYNFPEIKKIISDIFQMNQYAPQFLGSFLKILSPDQCKDLCKTFFADKQISYTSFSDFEKLTKNLDSNQHRAVLPHLKLTIKALLRNPTQRYLLFGMYSEMNNDKKDIFGKIVLSLNVDILFKFEHIKVIFSALTPRHQKFFYEQNKEVILRYINSSTQLAEVLALLIPDLAKQLCGEYFNKLYVTYQHFSVYENILNHLDDYQCQAILPVLQDNITLGFQDDLNREKLITSLKNVADDKKLIYFASFMIYLDGLSKNQPSIKLSNLSELKDLLTLLKDDQRDKAYDQHKKVIINCFSNHLNLVGELFILFKPEKHITICRDLFNNNNIIISLLNNYVAFSQQFYPNPFQEAIYPSFKHALVKNLEANPEDIKLFNDTVKTNFIKFIVNELTLLEVLSLLKVNFNLFIPLIKDRLKETVNYVENFFDIYNHLAIEEKKIIFNLFENKFFINLSAEQIELCLTLSKNDPTISEKLKPLVNSYVNTFKTMYFANNKHKPLFFKGKYLEKLEGKNEIEQFVDIRQHAKDKKTSHTHEIVEHLSKQVFKKI